jgi:hypothetical protein
MTSDPTALTPEDLDLLERVAVRVVELRLEVPAILTLESVRPMSVVAGQAMIFFQPLAQALLRFGDYRRFAALAERRETIEALVTAIERRAEAARRARTTASPPAPGAAAGPGAPAPGDPPSGGAR